MHHSRERNARNIRAESTRPLAYTITHRDLLKRSSAAFREFVGPRPGGAKIVADVLDCSDRTAQNYLDGRNLPGGIHDLRALHAVPPYAAMKREIAAMETAIDPRLQAKLSEFARAMALYGDNLFGHDEAPA